MRQIIHIYGASGSGTSTLGEKISKELGYKFMDSDDYFWMPTNPKFTTIREASERIRLMREDIEKADNVVIAGSLCDWGDELIPLFTLALRVVTDTDTRIMRIRKREYERFGDRINAGGDMQEQHEKFIAWAKQYDTGSITMRSKAKHDSWQQLLACHQISVDGARDTGENYEIVKRELVFTDTLDKVKKSIEGIFEGEASGHDYWHSIRVFHNACRISNMEQSDWRIVSLAALLHDTDDCKLFNTKNYENARKIMTENDIADEIQEAVIDCIKKVSFKGKDTVTPESIEGKIVQDADRLDAIGAIGIARAFAYGGSRGRMLYDPKVRPKLNLSEAEYKANNSSTINHFYEKLFLLKDLMNTEYARRMAEERNQYMEQYVQEFFDEWNGLR